MRSVTTPRIAPTLRDLVVPITTVKRSDRSARRGDRDVLLESLTTHGQYRPIVVNTRTGECLAGNRVLDAALELGWDELAITTVDVDDDAATRILLVDNRASETGWWDSQALADLLASMPDLTGTGYDEETAAAIIAATTPPPVLECDDPDEAPELQAETITRPGDVWRLGPHTLICGDSTDAEVVAMAMGDASAHMVFTDPPYGVAYVGKTRDAMTIANDALGPEALGDLLRAAFRAGLSVCAPGAMWWVTAPHGPVGLPFSMVLHELGIWHQSLV